MYRAHGKDRLQGLGVLQGYRANGRIYYPRFTVSGYYLSWRRSLETLIITVAHKSLSLLKYFPLHLLNSVPLDFPLSLGVRESGIRNKLIYEGQLLP